MKQLERQLANKKAQLKTLQQKCELQNKKIKLLRKENQQFKSNLQKQSQIDTALLISSKQISDANSKIQLAIQQLQKQLQQPNITSAPSVITIGNLTINQQTSQVDLTGLSLIDQDVIPLTVFPNLQTLILSDNSATNQSVKIICQKLKNLKKLYLTNNKFTVEALENIHNLTELRHLDLRGNKLQNKVSSYISQLIGLQELSLSYVSLTDDGTIQLSKLINLSYLDMTNNQITDEGAKNLLKLKKLSHLYLGSNKIGALGVRWLIKDLNLSVLDVRFNKINNQQKQIIRGSKPQSVQLFL